MQMVFAFSVQSTAMRLSHSRFVGNVSLAKLGSKLEIFPSRDPYHHFARTQFKGKSTRPAWMPNPCLLGPSFLPNPLRQA